MNLKLVLKVAVGGCWVRIFISERVSEPALHFRVGNVIRHGICGNWNEITRKQEVLGVIVGNCVDVGIFVALT